MGSELSRYLQGTGKALSIPVAGTSMLPCLKPGDLLLVSCVQESFGVGQVLVVLGNSALIVHRVVDVVETEKAETYVTKGDNSRSLDPPVGVGAILGKVERLERAGRTCSLDHPVLRPVSRRLARLSFLLSQLTAQGADSTGLTAHGTKVLGVIMVKSLFLLIRSTQGWLVSWLLWRSR